MAISETKNEHSINQKALPWGCTDLFSNTCIWPQVIACLLLTYSFQLRYAFQPWNGHLSPQCTVTSLPNFTFTCSQKI